jgi:hypothetical protein
MGAITTTRRGELEDMGEEEGDFVLALASNPSDIASNKSPGLLNPLSRNSNLL